VTVEVHVVTPERELWTGEASMVVARGTEGEVGILAGHAPLLVRLAEGTVRIHGADAEPVAVAVGGGFLHVTSQGGSTRIDVLASRGELGDDRSMSRSPDPR